MEFPVWATPGENRKLFGKAKANGADDLTLSDLDATTGFLEGKSGDGGTKLDQIQLQLKALQISREHKGISTASEWVTSLRAEGSLAVGSHTLDTFLEDHAVNWWPTADVTVFPPVGAMETATCQPYVTARINEITNCGGQVHSKKQIRILGTSAYVKDSTVRVDFRSIPVDGHAVVSYSGRSPDIPCYNGGRRGGCSITMLGDVKACGPRNKDFPEAEVGHILDMGTDLMTKEQFTRTTLYCFLTDGFRFQFFRCSRSQHGHGISYEQSAIYGGEHGWQIFFGLLIAPTDDLGFVTFDVPNWRLLDGLGRGRFSSVFSCRSTQSDEVVVLKVFRGNIMHMATTERNVLTSLSEGGVANVPSFKELHLFADFHALILTPLGIPVLPCPVSADVTPNMLVALLNVVQMAHNLNWIHRDIKPDNIYLVRADTSRIVLNDWSSAVPANVECDYVGTRLFGDGPGANNKHTPDQRLDLRSLVKTAFCLSKQRMPMVEDIDGAVQQYWNRVKLQSPLFRKAMDFADAVTPNSYLDLRELFANVW